MRNVASPPLPRRGARVSASPAPAARPSAGAASMEALYALRPVALWRALVKQPPSFWFINLYLLFEYVRPQSIYTILEGPPWTQITLLLALGAFFLEGKMFQLRSSVDVLLCVFTAVLVLSSMSATFPEISYARLPDYLSWVLIYLLIANIVTTEKRFLVFMLAFLLYSFKMSQHSTRSWASDGFAFRDWGTTGAPGWFENSGEFGIQMTIFIPLVCYFASVLKARWGKPTRLIFYAMVATAVTGTIGSSSRGAMVGAGVVAVFMLAKTRHKAKGAAFIVVLALFVAFMMPEESRARFQGMGDDATSVSRKEYWAAGIDAMQEHPVLGIGYANWSVYMRREHGRMGLPHNIFVQAGSELGYLGLFALVGLLGAHFAVNRRTRKLLKPLGAEGAFMTAMAHGLDAALVGFMVSGSFITVLYYPYLWINLAMTAALHNAARSTVAERSTPGLVRGRMAFRTSS